MVATPRIRVVLQARMTSTRLPGKVLLPVCGLPVAVLAAKRAARDGIETVVATSSDPSDDRLAEVLEKHGVGCVRGSLHDVLARYVLATKDLADNDICVRLTSDDVFPDSDFVRRLVTQLENTAVGYSGMQGGNDGLPFGLAGEAMRVGLLRQAAQTTDDPYDHEHVTPWVIRRCGRNAPVILPPWGIDLTGVRCTIDTLDDYRTVAAALAGLDDPVSVPWQTMCERLARWMTRARPSVPARIVAGELHASLVLGGAPIGLAHSVRKPDDKELHAILDLAEAAGVTHVDTAAGYGDSEHRIGSALTADSPLGIVTKLPPHLMDGEPTTREVAQRVHVAIDRSVWLLGRSRLEAVLLHRFEHFDAAEGVIWRTLLALQAEGKVGRIGASVDRPDELSALLASPEVGLVQVPFNILDRRWLEPDIQRAIAARPDVVIHGCSALLQGLLTINDPSEWPIPDGDLAHRCTAGLQAAARSLGRESVADLCFAYVRAQPWLAGIIVGAETAAQMSENIRLFRTPALTLAQAEGVAASLPGRVPEQLLNPALWPRR